MSDLISRQEAIDTLTEYGDGKAVYISVEEAVRRIEQLPPTPPKTVCVAEIMLSDEQTQEVIEKIKKKLYLESQHWLSCKLREKKSDPTYTGKRFEGYEEAILAVKSKLRDIFYTMGDNKE